MNAIMTVTIGSKYERIAEVTHPTIKRYAKKIGADFVVIDGKSPGQEDIVPHFAKLRCHDLLEEYERIIFVDSDIIIRDDCPNLFDLVQKDEVGAFMEGQFIPRRRLDLEMAARTYSTPIIGIKNPDDWRGEYYNTGVLVVSRCHKTIFTPPDFEKIRQVEGAWDYGEQGWLNLQIINGCVSVRRLSHRFNHMSVMDKITGEHRLMSFIIHYAGAPEVIRTPEAELDITELIQKDVDMWAACNGDYSRFKRGVYVRVGGGLGDQVDAEPVVRRVAELYSGCDIVVASDWPRLFKHVAEIRVCVVNDVDKTMKPDQPYYPMETLPIPESPFGVFVSHPLVHSTDYSSLSCLRRTLSSHEKTIKLITDLDDVASLADKIGIDDLKRVGESVVVHPGRGWASKTFPSSWWQSVIDELSANVHVCLIGKSIGDDQGLVNVQAPKNSVDLRDKTSLGELLVVISSAPVLISNDSAPIHIAGAFDGYIIAIPTCKRPEHILPWRHGCQDHKAICLYNKLITDDIGNLPTQVYGETVDWIPKRNHGVPPGMEFDAKDNLKGGDILDYLPNPSLVVSQALEFRRRALC